MPQFTIDPLSSPGELDVIVAAGVQSPGVARLMSGGDRAYNWDIKQAPGVQGYVMTYRGWKGGDPIVFRFEFFNAYYLKPDSNGVAQLASTADAANQTQSQIQNFYEQWVPLFAIDARKIRPTPVEVYHPVLFANDIHAVVCQKIGPLQTDGNMRWWVDMTFLEYRPPRLIPTSTPQGATAKFGAPTPQNRIQEQIEAEKVLAARPL